ncbi:flagellar hook-associated protein FlgK [Erythrobacter sp. T5W1-R]|uniref:flagellar hook-associated protein FlgK n=1 Tax=Erythrobacter sp. T5W1-R TaxID=3101752 RepID=UPI002B00355E|nr:flagellar hook-associated protein FlgK [Erythrobacter sp. T5W1-R]MEA1619126.1 flagellar hook-associated protein FlgK [Erythrobacter sp. T5W1-R]
MPIAMFSIGRSGLLASRTGLELTSQNIANATNGDFSRRSLTQSEVVGTGNIGFNSSDAFGGVRLSGIERVQSALVQRQARDSASALASTSAQLRGLAAAETALERTQLFDAMVAFEAALTRLESDPTNIPLRTSVVESARRLAGTFNTANETLANARGLTVGEAEADVMTVNTLTEDLARINRELVAARDGSASKAALLDSRDAALRKLADQLGITASFNENGTVLVTANGTPEVPLVDGGTSAPLSLDVAANGTIGFTIGGTGFVPASGAMAGRAAALQGKAEVQDQLDALANNLITLVNTAQAAGSDLAGSPGQPMFAGTGAGNIAVVMVSGAGLATAPGGASPGSRDTANLTALLSGIAAETGPVAGANGMLLQLSSRVAGLELRREGLSIVAATAEGELRREIGVDLDTEAANLVRLQQAFEANSRVIQVAANLFDTILALR